MKSIYTSYKCVYCGKEFILLTEELEQQFKQSRYLVCPYCNSKKVKREKTTNDLRKCMSENSYKRTKGGALRQVRYK